MSCNRPKDQWQCRSEHVPTWLKDMQLISLSEGYLCSDFQMLALYQGATLYYTFNCTWKKDVGWNTSYFTKTTQILSHLSLYQRIFNINGIRYILLSLSWEATKYNLLNENSIFYLFYCKWYGHFKFSSKFLLDLFQCFAKSRGKWLNTIILKWMGF